MANSNPAKETVLKEIESLQGLMKTPEGNTPENATRMLLLLSYVMVPMFMIEVQTMEGCNATQTHCQEKGALRRDAAGR